MPEILTYFDNGFDPTLPNQIKPALYTFDEYQTYDLIAFSPIKKKLATFIKKYFGQETLSDNVNCFSSICLNYVVLIERFTPFEYDWCNDYADKLKESFIDFSGSGIQSIASTHDIDDLYTNDVLFNSDIDWGSQLAVQEYNENWKQLTLTIPATDTPQTIILTWLCYCDYDKCASYNKTYKKIITKKSEYTLKIKLNYIQPCSLKIMSSDNNVYDSIYEQIPLVFRYGYFDFVFNQLKVAINNAFPKLNYYLSKIYANKDKVAVNNYIDSYSWEIYNDQWDWYEYHESLEGFPYQINPIFYPYIIEGGEGQTIWSVIVPYSQSSNNLPNFPNPSILTLSIDQNSALEFSELPIAAKKSIIVYANNNYWNNQNINNQDEGELFIYEDNSFSVLPKAGYATPKVINIVDVNGNNRFFTLIRNYDWLGDTPINVYYNNLDDNSIITISDDYYYPNEIFTTGERTMPDSVRLKEIHQALEASKFAYDEDDTDINRVANLGYYIERIARVLGISVNSDGTIRSIRQSKWIKQGETLPSGWPIAQWGVNSGGSSEGQSGGSSEEERDGLAYDVRSNRIGVDQFSGEPTAIEQGGYVLVENIPQLLHIILNDFDKALGMDAAGAGVIPSINEQPKTYEGLTTLISELCFAISSLSRSIRGNHLSSLKNQGMLYELIAAHGTPIDFKTIEQNLNELESAKIIYPAIKGPTTFEQNLWILQQISLIIGSLLNLREAANQEEN